MRSLIGWLVCNKEWLFSGVGVVILFTLVQRRATVAKVAKSLFARPTLAGQVKLLLQDASIQIDRPDEGLVTFNLYLINLSCGTITVDRVGLDSWSLLSRSLPELPPLVRGLDSPVPKQSLRDLYMSLQLNSAAIRRIREALPKDVRQLIGGNLALYATGTFHVKEVAYPITYQLQTQNPRLSFYWLKEGTGAGV